MQPILFPPLCIFSAFSPLFLYSLAFLWWVCFGVHLSSGDCTIKYFFFFFFCGSVVTRLQCEYQDVMPGLPAPRFPERNLSLGFPGPASTTMAKVKLLLAAASSRLDGHAWRSGPLTHAARSLARNCFGLLDGWVLWRDESQIICCNLEAQDTSPRQRRRRKCRHKLHKFVRILGDEAPRIKRGIGIMRGRERRVI